MSANRILVLGTGGLMGRYVMAEALKRGLPVQGRNRVELDITGEEKVRRIIDEIKPDWVLNAAACARMEQCAENPENTRKLNTDAPAFLAKLGREKGFRFCHVSSDYIFDGKAKKPYDEDSEAGPLSEYARQKAAADAIVSQYHEHLILRVAWLFGEGGGTFMSKMPAMMLDRPVLQVASGRKGSCLYMGIGAAWILELLAHDASGIYNLVHPGETTWEEFAHFTLEKMKQRGLKPRCERIEVIPMSNMRALQEPRPEYSTLSVDKLQKKLGRDLDGWREGVGAFLSERRENAEILKR